MDELIKRLRRDTAAFTGFVERDLKEAADAIEELQQQVEHYHGCMNDWFEAAQEYKAQIPRWIPVSERLPEVPGTYLVLLKEPKKWAERRVRGEAEEWENFDFSHVEPAFYNKDQSIWDDDDIPMNANLDVVNINEAFHVTHWMPLPEYKEEEE